MKPEKITRMTLAAKAAQRWDEQYRRDYPDKKETHHALIALGPSPSPDDVDRVIGNKSWTRVPTCDGCDREGLDAVVRVGQKMDYDSATAELCLGCLLEAAALFQDSST